jgi:DNA-directed RNA polymerase specialized sigma24 family protein
VTCSPERRDQVGAFFAAHADHVRRAVRRRVERVGDEIIEDACQIAWATLLRRSDITLDRSGLGWLTTVAVHEAWRQGSTAEATLAGTFIGTLGVHDEGELPEPADTEHLGTEDKVLDRLEHIERFHAMHALKPAQREALYLKGLGYSYQEIMRLTSASYTAVNRRITEGHAALRRHLGEDSGPRRWLPRH